MLSSQQKIDLFFNLFKGRTDVFAQYWEKADNHKRCLVLTERKDHVEILRAYLKSKYEIIVLTGDLTEKQRREKIKQIQAGHFQILIATGQLIGRNTVKTLETFHTPLTAFYTSILSVIFRYCNNTYSH